MNIGLIDVDSHNFPNLVLMKLSAWHKAQGDVVYLLKPRDILNGQNLFQSYGRLYGACVFSGHKEIVDALEKIGATVGGTGTKNNVMLPDLIEHIMPDCSLYGVTDTAYGFLTRGCPRQCPFCIVSKKEGAQSRKVADLSEWWAGQKIIKLLDPNLLACPEHEYLLKQLAESGAWVDITQGLDIRLLTGRDMNLINRLKLKNIHFAWDHPRDGGIKEKLKFFMAKTTMSVKHRRPSVYVLTNYWSTHGEDLMRVYWLRDNGFDPYIMKYKDMQVDHIVPLHRGGEDGEGNYYPACRACNYYKHTLTVEDFRREIGEIRRRFRARNFRYRMALKYGIISETENEIRFYFEKITRRDTCDHKSHDDE